MRRFGSWYIVVFLAVMGIAGVASGESIRVRSGVNPTLAWTGSEPANPYRGYSWPNLVVNYRDTATNLWEPAVIIGENPAWANPAVTPRTYVWSRNFNWYGGGWKTFKAEFDLPSDAINIDATFTTFVDNAAKIYVNGTYLGNNLINFFGQNFTSGWWHTQQHVPSIRTGRNVVEFICYDEGGSGVGLLYDFAINYDRHVNHAPLANAGANMFVASSEAAATVIAGNVSDLDNDAVTYRWLEGTNQLTSPRPAGALGEAPLPLSEVTLGIGPHTLTLEASDGTLTASSMLLVTIGNSEPTGAVTLGGTIQAGTSVKVTGTAADFDGDTLTYRWLQGETELAGGVVETVQLGAAVVVPEAVVSGLPVGPHVISLELSDGVNQPVIATTVITVIDTLAPTLSLSASSGILWPPNHNLIPVVVTATASDNSGAPVTLNATASSSEPEDALGDGTTVPDVVGPVIDQATGTITFELRSERSGSGPGRSYMIFVTATDQEGNSSTGSVQVKAPHNMGKK